TPRTDTRPGARTPNSSLSGPRNGCHPPSFFFARKMGFPHPGAIFPPLHEEEAGMSVAAAKAHPAPLKSLYELGEIPPLGHVPEKMHAWAIRKERHGPPESSMQVEVLPTWPIADDEVLVLVMAGGVNYNGVWA